MTIEQAAKIAKARGAYQSLLIASGSDVRPRWNGRATVDSVESQKAPEASPAMMFLAVDYAPCPMCGSTKSHRYARKSYGDYVKCSRCGLIYLDPSLDRVRLEQLYDKPYFEGKRAGQTGVGYEGYATTELDKRLAKARAQMETVQRYFGERHGRLLDVGAAAGYVVKAAREFGWKADGVDLSGHMVDLAKKLFGISITKGMLDDLLVRADSYDAATLFDTIEHMPDPKRELRQINRLMKKGGLIFIYTPDMSSLVSQVHGADFSEIEEGHLVLFSRQTLEDMLRRTGFELVDVLSDTIGPEDEARIRAGQDKLKGTKMTLVARKVRDAGLPVKNGGETPAPTTKYHPFPPTSA